LRRAGSQPATCRPRGRSGGIQRRHRTASWPAS